MLTPRRRWAAISLSPGDALGAGHHLLRPQLRDDGVEMLEVIDLEGDRAVCKSRRALIHADVVDVAVVLGDHLGDLGERAGLVQRLDCDPRWKPLRRALVHIPAYVEP